MRAFGRLGVQELGNLFNDDYRHVQFADVPHTAHIAEHSVQENKEV